jgi:hypothetical protein
VEIKLNTCTWERTHTLRSHVEFYVRTYTYSTFARRTLRANVHRGRLLFINLCCLNFIYVVYIFNPRCTLVSRLSTDFSTCRITVSATAVLDSHLCLPRVVRHSFVIIIIIKIKIIIITKIIVIIVNNPRNM